MSFEDSVEALKNLTNGKYFILLEEGVIPGRVKVINPEGHIINVADKLFDPDFERITRDEFSKHFTEPQLQALSMFNDESAIRMQRELELAQSTQVESTSSSTTSSTSGEAKERVRRTTTKAASKAYDPRRTQAVGRVASEWSSSQLTFYRHKIDPLRPTDQFCVSVDGEGDFVISKMEFLKLFNNVVMDPVYRSQGIFKFQNIPDSAIPFMKKR